MLGETQSQGQKGTQESQTLYLVFMEPFDFWWPISKVNTCIYCDSLYTATILCLLLKSPTSFFTDQAAQPVCHWSLLICQLSMRWFGCSQYLPFMFNFGCHVPEMDGRCEAQSTTFNSFINQASVYGMNYWLSEFRGNCLFLFSPWWTCFAVVRSILGQCRIMGCLFLARKWG